MEIYVLRRRFADKREESILGNLRRNKGDFCGYLTDRGASIFRESSQIFAVRS
jgi:hypothetical protein